MASAFRACLFIVVLSILGPSLESRLYHVPSMAQKGIDSHLILREMGFDTPKMEYYRKRSLLDAETTRVSPGGPDPEHHRKPTALP